MRKLSNDDFMRLLGAASETARIMIWVRDEIGHLRERRRLMHPSHVRRIAAVENQMAPLVSLERRLSAEHEHLKTAVKENHP